MENWLKGSLKKQGHLEKPSPHNSQPRKRPPHNERQKLTEVGPRGVEEVLVESGLRPGQENTVHSLPTPQETEALCALHL